MTDNTVIALFCYKRTEKLKASVSALLRNPECASMDIIFFSDGPKNITDYADVMRTRAYIESITGFRNVYKHFREHNLSTGPNFFAGINYLSSHYDRFIVVEDDLVVTSNYIRYMLDALSFYKDDADVFCITGYCFPLNKGAYPYDTVMSGRFCSYGWGSWSEKVKHVKWDNEALQGYSSTPGFTRHLTKWGSDLPRLLRKQIDGTISTWDIQMQVHVAAHNFKIVYPVISKTSNIGFDSQSTNTFGVDYLQTNVDPGLQRTFRFCNASISAPVLKRQLKKPYELPALVTRKLMNNLISVFRKLKAAV